jgi:ribosomal 30S subunit maturation factor RimM
MALRPISRIEDYRFPDDAWDVRGWAVQTEAEEEKVGRVDDMLLDRGGTLRYLDVDLGFLKKHVLVPLDRAHASREQKTVWIEGMTKDQLEAVPEYALDPETLDESYERRLDAVYGGTSASAHERLLAPDEDDRRELELRRMSAIEDEYQVAGDDPRGWKVVTGEGQTVGRVAELLMAPAEMKALFLDVVVDEGELELEPVDRHILLPTQRVRLDRKNKQVLVSGLLAHDLAGYPHYGGLPVTRGATRELEKVFDRAATAEPGAETATTERSPETDWRERTVRHFYQPGNRRRQRATEEE